MSEISIILPVYNGIQFLEQSVLSVLGQDDNKFEFLIIDDCSTDNSWEYLSSIKDERVKIFKNEVNKGLFFNLNFLINKSTSPLIKLWGQDDIMYNNCIKEIIEFHSQNPQIGFSYTACNYMIENNNEAVSADKIDATPSIISSELHARIAFLTGSISSNISNVTLSKRALDKVGLFNENMKMSGDFDMWVRIAEHYPVGFLNKKLIQVRKHSQQLSRQERYYVIVLKEGIQIYNYLLSYVNKNLKKEGRNLLRNYSLLFYYTLMVKAFLKGHFKIGYIFFKTLNYFDNIWVLSFYFLRNRILFPKKYWQFYFDNTQFFKSVKNY